MQKRLGSAVLAGALLILGGCADRQPRTAQQAAVAACRKRADDVYMKQNRYLLSERDTRDSPFSSRGLVGITSAGLGREYGREEMVDDCVAGTTGSTTTTGVTEIGPSHTTGGGSAGFGPSMTPGTASGGAQPGIAR